MLAGCQSWTGLAKKIITRYPDDVFSSQEKQLLTQMSEKDPRRVISICYTRLRFRTGLGKEYYSAIKESVTPQNPSDAKKFEDIHNKIFRLDALSYVTTNIDRGMEAVTLAGIQNSRVFNMPVEAFDPERDLRGGNIFYLHGSKADLDKTIFTIDNYYEYYSGFGVERERVRKFLKNIFKGDLTVLFIGYGLEEQEILQNIFTAVSSNSEQYEGPKHFLLAPLYSKDIADFNLRNMYLDIHSVKAVPYFIDFDGYEKLNEVLDRLQKLITDSRPSPIQLFNKIDEAL